MRSTPMVLALLASLLAGCSGSSSPPSGDDDVGVITDPRDLANRTGEHVHDYWGGKETVDLVDATQESTWNTIAGQGNWRRTFVSPDEVVVPQGTASINITVDWEDGSQADNYGAVSVWVKPANTVEPRFVGEIGNGDTVEVRLAYEEADLPHQLLSAWEYIVQYNNSGEAYSAFFLASTHLVATAHRGLDLQPFPAHPDLWQGRDGFPLADDRRAMTNVGYTGSGSLPQVIRALDGALVPPDAARVTVRVTLESADPLPQAGAVQVWYHAADSRQWVSLGVVSSVAGTAEWDVAVGPGMGDGPYGNASLWQFRVYTSEDATQPRAHAGNVHLEASVHKS